MNEPQAHEAAAIGGVSRRRRLILLVELWNRWIREQVDRDPEAIAYAPISRVFPERTDLARGALDLAELLGAIASESRFPLARGTVLDRFVAATFPRSLRGWLWDFLSQEIPA